MLSKKKALECLSFPSFLYKYRSASEIDLDTLKKNKVFVPTFYDLNDIFESDFHFDMDEAFQYTNQFSPTVFRNEFGEPVLIPSTFSRKLDAHEREEHEQRVMKIVNELRERVFSKGVYCLSKSPVNNLMWGHYGNSHQGYCIEYKLPIKEELIEHPNLPRGIDYQSERPSINWVYANLYPFSMLMYYMIGVKHQDWAYEEEFRIIYPEGAKEYDLPLEVSSIIFGARAGQALIDEIKAIFSDSVNYKRATTIPRSFEMDLVDI